MEGLGLDYGFELDTGRPSALVTRAATHDKLDVTIYGRPAHAGKDPEKGVNALQVAADAIHGMRLGRIGPETTANLGKIEGGSATNVVMAELRINAEARSTDVAALDAQTAHMRERFEEAAVAWGAWVEIAHHRHYASYRVPDDAPVVRVAQRAARALGFEPTLRHHPRRLRRERVQRQGTPLHRRRPPAWKRSTRTTNASGWRISSPPRGSPWRSSAGG